MPERIQMSRSHPWRAEHPDAVIVDRRTKWGNPFRVIHVAAYWPADNALGDGPDGRGQWIVQDDNGVRYPEPWASSRASATRDAVRLFYDDITYFGASRLTVDEIRAELAGRDLACWCDLDALCHADVLLALANPTPAPAGVSAAPTTRGGPIGPAGAPIPTTSEEQCERCGRILDCCRRCPVHEGDVDE